MFRRSFFSALLCVLCASASGFLFSSSATAQAQAPEPADLVLLNTKVWTGQDAFPQNRPASAPVPWASAVAIRGDRIVYVGKNEEARRYIRKGHTRVLDLKGRLVLPGFIDNHVHFAQAGRLLLGLNLLDVNTPDEFRKRVGEAAARLPADAWLTGGDWGAYGQWGKESSGVAPAPALSKVEGSLPAGGAGTGPREFLPTKDLIDSFTGDHPALISRFDQQLFLANSLAIKAAGITRDTPNPEGGEILRDSRGEPNGLLRGTAGQLVRKVIPRASYAQRRAEALRALDEMRRFGVTSVHDNVADFDQLQLLYDLRQSGDLTARFWARMWLSEWERVRNYIREKNLAALNGGWGDDHIRLGGLKAWVDGIMGNSSALFFEPYTNNPKSAGRLRDVMFPEGNLYRLISGADRAGFTVTVHAIGDQANRILLDTYERVFAENPARDRRFRVVHAQVLAPEDVPRLGRLKLVAEVQPYHCIDDMRWMEERIGPRSSGAYAFRSIAEAGAVMSFGSDWPGTNASYYPINPMLGIYAAVTRQTLTGIPSAGWFPAQRIALESAVRYFTANNAYVTFEENSKGTLQEGKLADLVVLDRNIFSRPARELLETKVLFTIFNGKVVYEGK